MERKRHVPGLRYKKKRFPEETVLQQQHGCKPMSSPDIMNREPLPGTPSPTARVYPATEKSAS